MKVVLSPEAAEDLEEIVEAISAQNPGRAESFVAELREKCLSLSATPEAFPVVGEYGGAEIRRRVHKSYLIFYRLRAENVVIWRVLHSARDHVKILGLSPAED